MVDPESGKLVCLEELWGEKLVDPVVILYNSSCITLYFTPKKAPTAFSSQIIGRRHSNPVLDSCVFCCRSGPGHQRVQPFRGRDPPGAGSQKEAGRGAETAARCFQKPAVSLQVTFSPSSLRTCHSLCCTNAVSLSMCVCVCVCVRVCECSMYVSQSNTGSKLYTFLSRVEELLRTL